MCVFSWREVARLRCFHLPYYSGPVGESVTARVDISVTARAGVKCARLYLGRRGKVVLLSPSVLPWLSDSESRFKCASKSWRCCDSESPC